MTASVRLELPFPPSANRYWRTFRGRVVPSEEAAEYKRQVALLMAGRRPLTGSVSMYAVIRFPRRAGDLGNRLKVLEDSLIGFGYIDDSQISHYAVTRSYLGPPGVELILVGESFATPEQVREAAEKRDAANQKRRATLKRNRTDKAMMERARGQAGFKLTPAVIRGTR